MASVVLVILILILRTVIARMFSSHIPELDLRLRWQVNIRNGLTMALALGLGIIWINELQNVGVAILGLGVAFVIAIKEFLLCINGSFLRAVTNSYSVGDRIGLAGHRGDVVDLNLFATTLLEVGPGKPFHLRTGRTVIIPNSKLLDSPLVNESHMKRFVLHVFSVPLPLDEDWHEAENLLLEAARPPKPTVEEAKP
jgi:small-conductance mechanosensitive channel